MEVEWAASSTCVPIWYYKKKCHPVSLSFLFLFLPSASLPSLIAVRFQQHPSPEQRRVWGEKHGEKQSPQRSRGGPPHARPQPTSRQKSKTLKLGYTFLLQITRSLRRETIARSIAAVWESPRTGWGGAKWVNVTTNQQ